MITGFKPIGPTRKPWKTLRSTPYFPNVDFKPKLNIRMHGPLCTLSLAVVTETKLTYLGKDILRKWEEEFPGIEPGLNRFCQRQDTIGDLIQKGELHRRVYKRPKTSSQATIQLLDNLDQPVKKPFKVILLDIFGDGVG